MPYEELDMTTIQLIMEELLHKTLDLDDAFGPGHYKWEVGYKVEKMLRDELNTLYDYDFSKKILSRDTPMTLYNYPITMINRQNPWVVKLYREV